MLTAASRRAILSAETLRSASSSLVASSRSSLNRRQASCGKAQVSRRYFLSAVLRWNRTTKRTQRFIHGYLSGVCAHDRCFVFRCQLLLSICVGGEPVRLTLQLPARLFLYTTLTHKAC